MINQGGNGHAHERPCGKLSRSGWRSLASGVAALALVASAGPALAGGTIHADVLVTNSALGSGGLGGQLLGYSAGQKNAEKPTTTLSGGNNFLIGPSGVAIDLPLGLEGVTSGLANIVTFYQLGANGNTSPIGLLSNPKFTPAFPVTFPLNLDTGIAAQADDRVWITSLSPPICAVTSIAGCTTTSADLCGSGSISRWTVGATTPDLVIGGCPANGIPAALDSQVFAPIGIFVDSTEVVFCADATQVTGGSQGACASSLQSQVVSPTNFSPSSASIPTNRVWIVNSLGYVSIYLPEAADAAGLFALTNTAFPPSPATNVFFSEPPLGGFFATTTDNLLPPPLGASTDTTSPKYIAVDASETTAYITDLALGARRKATKGEFGRIKEFALMTVPEFQTCIEANPSVPSGCLIAIQNPLVTGSFSTSIEGRGTQLNAPQGIVTFNLGTGDFVMVANTGSNTVTEYAPGVSGNARPDAVLSSPGGKVHTLDLPVGLSLTPVP